MKFRLDDKTLEQLIDEMRDGFQIPHFYKDSSLKMDFNEADGYFYSLYPDVDYDTDLIVRGLLKNYVLYAYYKRIDEFKINYASSILEWQFSKFKGVVEDEEQDSTAGLQ